MHAKAKVATCSRNRNHAPALCVCMFYDWQYIHESDSRHYYSLWDSVCMSEINAASAATASLPPAASTVTGSDDDESRTSRVTLFDHKFEKK